MNEAPRIYTHPVNGTQVPSVTSILRQVGTAEGLIQWAANCAAQHAIDHPDQPGRTR